MLSTKVRTAAITLTPALRGVIRQSAGLETPLRAALREA
jgi:hypothetical protein